MIAIFLKIWLSEVGFYDVCSSDTINFSSKILDFNSPFAICIYVELQDISSVLLYVIISLFKF
jgi:hypothetical protein